jgi:hypothetical protein
MGYYAGNCYASDLLLVPNFEVSNTDNVEIDSFWFSSDKSTGRGQLYLRTREEEPYCAHQIRLSLHNSLHDLPIRTLGRIDMELESEGGLTEAFTITE